ncbi:DegT/DnrJ/EryC1/StrS family aminotransferase [Intrasporangium sp. YIM S08009]|uniref:DegT/DnrJ/EryC1/StrS family aminotransferase n=1 Tax=Intrasporangium zincisolvens TaxID=3080018 RepID=UPI002B054FAA|nr:DegT/DnrJ/EryC1/StrS family aminotransferase [Intrasporangium sp. YIM S08009]
MRPWLGEQEARAAADAVSSGWVAQGPRVAEFETRFAAHVGAAHGVAVSSCTTALHLALHLLGVGAGDEVVVPSFSFVATANCAQYVGARPVFADVEQDDGNLSVRTVEPVLTDRTRAVIVVHQGGVPADVEPLRRLCDSRGIALVEDAACAAGSRYHGAPVGAGSHLAAWSFHPRKLLTTGEGGMLTTTDASVAERARRLREHGMNMSAAARHASSQPVIESYLEVGFNYRMTDIQAAVGLVQLGKLDAMVDRRRELAARYTAMLADVPGVRPVRDPAWGETNFQSFWVELDDDYPLTRNELLAALAAAGVSARAGIMAAHRQPAYAGHPHVALPATERLTDSTLILPLFHTMQEREQEVVVGAVRRAAGLAQSA